MWVDGDSGGTGRIIVYIGPTECGVDRGDGDGDGDCGGRSEVRLLYALPSLIH